jgi:ubiquinone/menaquinone biosynthesis C-methylase UbiE
VSVRTNHFAHGSIGERYARFRPDFHLLAAAEIEKVIGRMEHALDVACGTGQSSRALASLANSVIGIDSSEEMLALAQAHPRVRFQLGAAEQLPFSDMNFDLVVTALAFHWFDQAAFLQEVKRVLAPGGYLAIYNDGFTGTMIDEPRYEQWHREVYLQRYPSPPRDVRKAKEQDWRGLAKEAHATFSHEVEFSAADWIGYLTTQSNVIVALESGMKPHTIEHWLCSETASFFEGQCKRLRFYCVLDIYCRTEAQ